MPKLPLLTPPKIWLSASLAALLLMLTAANPLPQVSLPESQDTLASLLVTSPLQVDFGIACKDAARVQINIDTATYDVIARKILPVDCVGQSSQMLSTKLYFDVFTQPTDAHLSITTYDKSDRMVSMYTNFITLSEVQHPDSLKMDESIPLHLDEPADGSEVTGTSLLIKGSIDVWQISPVHLQVVTQTGRILSHETIFIPSDVIGETYTFETTLSLPGLEESTDARLIMDQSAGNIFGIKFSTSVSLLLNQE
ncbi:MAG: hypothetical protein WA110_10400 [Anaerolineaceae bacterium]